MDEAERAAKTAGRREYKDDYVVTVDSGSQIALDEEAISLSRFLRTQTPYLPLLFVILTELWVQP